MSDPTHDIGTRAASSAANRRWRVPAPLRDLFEERLPRGVGWPHVLGSTLLSLIGVQFLTGILLALDYSSSTETAWESVRYIQERAHFGAIVRGIHHWAATVAIIVAALHILRVFIYAAYRKPRHWTWIVGVFLLLVLLGFGLTGYLLPWDLKAYFGTRVATAIPGSLPVLGPSIMRLVRGGDEVGNLTLTRFYAVHVILLPGALLGLLALHLWLVRRRGITSPWVAEGESAELGRTFFPYQAWKDSLAVLLVFGVVFGLAAGLGAPLEAKADPTNSSYVPRPDWYFLGLQHLLRIFQGKWQILGTAIIPNAALLLLLLVPWIDRNRQRRLAARPIALLLCAAAVATVVGLTLAGSFAVRREEAHLAQLLQQTKASAPSSAPATVPATDIDLAARGRTLYDALRCDACHGPDRKLEAPGLPPSLSLAGSKLRPAWIKSYLNDPTPIRYVSGGWRPLIRMPRYRLTDDESDALVAYLSTRVDPARFGSAADRELLASADPANGRRLFKEYQCRGCHTLGETGNRVGPDLTHVGRRLRPEYILGFVRDPAGVIPDTPMKDISLWDDEAAAVAAFLAEQR